MSTPEKPRYHHGDLRAALLGAADALPATPEEFALLAVGYVRFALDRPVLFRLMFGDPCSDTEEPGRSPQRSSAPTCWPA